MTTGFVSFRILGTVAGVLLLMAVILWLRDQAGVLPPEETSSFSLPEGFSIQSAADPGLTVYPMFAEFDDRGRLFVCESTGPNTMTTAEMLEAPSYRISLLEDSDADGVFDRSVVFADRLPFPQGGVFHQGSFYTAAAPDLLRLTDTDGDGRADRREVILTGWTLSANGATLHGPFLGPDGWLYLCDARRGYRIETREGKLLEGKGGRVWRCRLDGSGLEWVAAGGFDNPVELVFTPSGETIGTMTYFTDPQAGLRDALMHWVEGGVYPKPHAVIEQDRLPRTGGLMPVMTRLGRVAPAGLLRYQSSDLGPEYQGNLFSVQFNTHRIVRHILERDGASFRTREQEFLSSSDPDFHPTDIVEDADGSLLVLDTGGWFIQGCPVSVETRPQFKGGIYRIRRTGAPGPDDPRGNRLSWQTLSAGELAGLLDDPRFAVREKAAQRLVEQAEESVPALERLLSEGQNPLLRCAAVFALYRIGGNRAQEAIRGALQDADLEVRIAAARAAGLDRDPLAVPLLEEMVLEEQAAVRRQAATALGRIGDSRAAGMLLQAAGTSADRFLEHALIDSLIRLREREPLMRALRDPSARIRKAALISLDQMEDSPLAVSHLIPFLEAENSDLRRTALWIAAHRPEWAVPILSSVEARLRRVELAVEEEQAVQEVLAAFCRNPRLQRFLAEQLRVEADRPQRHVFLMETMDQCSLSDFPRSWIESIRIRLRDSEQDVRSRAVELLRAGHAGGLEAELRAIARDPGETTELRVLALDAIAKSGLALASEDFELLVRQLNDGVTAALRQLAAGVVGRAHWTEEQLVALAEQHLPSVGPLVMSRLLDAFEKSASARTGKALIEALEENPAGLDSFSEEQLNRLLAGFPGEVREAASPLRGRLKAQRTERRSRLFEWESKLSGGNAERGREVFFGRNVSCSSCHAIGSEGGSVGPDLTSIGAIRSRHDLLESILFPSASFVREYETYRVVTNSGAYSGIRTRQTPDVVVLVNGPGSELRIRREEILSMETSPLSMMPDGLDTALSSEEMSDLLAFLESQR